MSVINTFTVPSVYIEIFKSHTVYSQIDSNDREYHFEVGGEVNLGDKVIPILVSSDYNFGMINDMIASISEENSQIIINPSSYRKLKKKDIKTVALLYHEVGHIYNQDFNRFVSTEEYDTKRQELIDKGIVMDIEINADLFAASQVGKSVMIAALQEEADHFAMFYNVHPKKREELNRIIDASINEIKQRIKRLQERTDIV